MKVYAINGSPRRNKNTATLLDKVLEGVKAAHPEAETERIDIYTLNYTGCKSCFACKRKDNISLRKCAIKDDLQPVLEKLATADAAIFGSPIYYSSITGQLHSFYERLFFPYMLYKEGYPNLVENKMKTACIYTMNDTEENMVAGNYQQYVGLYEMNLERYFSKPEVLYSFNTYQFDDYSKYICETFDEKEKRSYRDQQFPIDCEKAFELGKQLL